MNVFFVADSKPANWKYSGDLKTKKNVRKALEGNDENHSTNLCPCDEDESFEHEIDSLGLFSASCPHKIYTPKHTCI